MDLMAEQRKIRYAAFLAVLFCAAVLAAGYFILPRYITLPTTLAERIAFAIRADVFVVLWVFLGVGMVAHTRRHSAADIGAALSGPPSRHLAVQLAFLQNTLEQAVMAVVVHLALATQLSGPPLALIIAAVLLFGIGRLAFLDGYPKGAGGRAFGMITTVLPTLTGFVLTIYLMIAGD